MRVPGLKIALLSLFCVLLAASSLQGAEHEEEAFIGWAGETYRPKQPSDLDQKEPQAEKDGASGDARRRWIETISWSPRAFVYHNFMTHEECDHVVSLVKDKVSRSSVIDTKTGASKLDPIRTSYGGVIMRGADDVIKSIEERISLWTRLPQELGEAIQVLRYNDGQQYDAHWDWFDDPLRRANKTIDNRVATVLLYLSEVEEGGETALPLAVPIDQERQSTAGMSACAAKGTLAVQPSKGDALLFWDQLPNGITVDRAALHASCPTTKGTKWTATKWIHNWGYGRHAANVLGQVAACKDAAGVQCAAWVQAGKCDTEPEKMLGMHGVCRLSCEDCVVCASTDIICQRKNMRSLRLQKTLRGTLPPGGGSPGGGGA